MSRVDQEEDLFPPEKSSCNVETLTMERYSYDCHARKVHGSTASQAIVKAVTFQDVRECFEFFSFVFFEFTGWLRPLLPGPDERFVRTVPPRILTAVPFHWLTVGRVRSLTVSCLASRSLVLIFHVSSSRHCWEICPLAMKVRCWR